MFKRKIFKELQGLKQNGAKKALLIKGARQVGNTTAFCICRCI
jgi:predicted AAA+ superfamily ATPase